MKKNVVLTFVLMFSLTITFGQNIEFTKEFKSDLNCKEYADENHLAIHYHKCFGDKILKYHDSQLQLLDADAEVLWEKPITALKNFNNDVNRFQVTSDDKFIYLAQAGQASLPTKVPIKIMKISEKGIIVEKDFTGTFTARQIDAFEIINNSLYLAYSGVYSGTLWNQTLVVLDFNLNVINGPVNLSEKSEDQKNSSFQHFWSYGGLTNNKLTFHTYYYDKEGTYSNFGNPLQEKWYKKAIVNENLVIEYTEPSKIVLGSQIRSVDADQLAHDTSKFKILVKPSGVEHDELIEFTDPNPFILHQQFNEVYIVSNEKRSENLVEDFFALIGKEMSKTSMIVIIDILDDPINESISGILVQHGTRNYFAFSIDDNLKFTHLIPFTLENSYLERYPDHNIGHHITKSNTENISYPEGYKKNALDFITTIDEDCFFTIMNYENYQLVFTDNKKTNICKVYKIVP